MNHKQQLFANTYLRLNDPFVAYKDGSKYRSIMSAANRLLRHPEIAAHINGVRDAAREQAQYELKEQMKEELLSVHDKRLYIKRVINGEILIPQDYKTNGCNRCTIFLRPTFPQILWYLKEDSRLAGHYPQQQKTTKKNSSFEGGVPTVGRDGGCFPGQESREEQNQQQQSEAFSLSPIEKTSTRQQQSEAFSLSPIEKTSTRQQNTTNDNTSPCPGDLGVPLTPDTREQQHPNTAFSLSPIEKTSTRQQQSEAFSLSPIEKTSTRQQTTTKNETENTSPLKGVPIAIGIGVSHTGLRKLFDKQRQRNYSKTTPA